MRSLVRSAVVASLFLSVCALPASAASPGDPPSSAPELLAATYGTVTINGDTTSPSAGHASGTHDAVCDAGASNPTQGASVYKISGAPAGARLGVTIDDDLSGVSLCGVEVFEDTVSGHTLTSIYTDPQRTTNSIAFDACLVSASHCEKSWTLPANDTYYLVFWPAGDGGGSASSTFNVVASVRQLTHTVVRVSGYYGSGKATCLTVHRGTTFSSSATVSQGATGLVVFTLFRRTPSGAWESFQTANASLNHSLAQHKWAGIKFGRYSVDAAYQGTDTSAPSRAARCVDVVTRSRTAEEFSGNSSTVGDYYVYHGGRTITVTATMAPSPMTGSVEFRLYRENNDTSNTYLKSYSRPVSSNVAVLKFSISYKRGLPYYRVVARYRGDRWHLGSTSGTECIKITR